MILSIYFWQTQFTIKKTQKKIENATDASNAFNAFEVKSEILAKSRSEVNKNKITVLQIRVCSTRIYKNYFKNRCAYILKINSTVIKF